MLARLKTDVLTLLLLLAMGTALPLSAELSRSLSRQPSPVAASPAGR